MDRVDTFTRSYESLNWFKLSRYKSLVDSEILSTISLKSKNKKAISIEDTSHYAVLSITNGESTDEIDSIYAALLTALKAIGISHPCTYRVNELGHIHVYLCFNEEFKGSELYPLIEDWLQRNDLDSSVSVIQTGEPIELPLQSGFTWLNENLLPIVSRDDISAESAIAMFLSDLKKGMLELDLFTLSITDLNSLEIEPEMIGQSRQDCLDFSPPDSEPKLVFEVEESQPVQTLTRQDALEEKIEEETTESKVIDQDKPEVNSNKEVEFLPPPGTTSFQQLLLPLNVDIPNKIDGRAPP